MCSQRIGSACGTSGSRELCGSGVRDERTARLQAAGVGTVDVSLSNAESGARQGIASAAARTGSATQAVRVSAADGDAGAGRNGAAVKPAASQPNQRWSMDFVCDYISTGKVIRTSGVSSAARPAPRRPILAHSLCILPVANVRYRTDTGSKRIAIISRLAEGYRPCQRSRH
jgi:hypothetical protein